MSRRQKPNTDLIVRGLLALLSLLVVALVLVGIFRDRPLGTMSLFVVAISMVLAVLCTMVDRPPPGILMGAMKVAGDVLKAWAEHVRDAKAEAKPGRPLSPLPIPERPTLQLVAEGPEHDDRNMPPRG